VTASPGDLTTVAGGRVGGSHRAGRDHEPHAEQLTNESNVLRHRTSGCNVIQHGGRVLAINNEGTILSLNEACATLLARKRRSCRAGIYEVIRKADLLQFIETALASRRPSRTSFKIRGPQDRWSVPTARCCTTRSGARSACWSFLHDNTRLRHLEEVRPTSWRNVSHELRTPITSIKASSNLVDGAFEDKENAHRFLQIMLRQVNRLDAIIGDLLVLVAIERGSENSGSKWRGNRSGRAPGSIEMLRKRAIDKAVKIELICPEDLTGEINAALLEQAVVNLLDNASSTATRKPSSRSARLARGRSL